MTNFTEVLKDSCVNFYGNMNVGKDIIIKVLKENNSGKVIDYGADNEIS